MDSVENNWCSAPMSSGSAPAARRGGARNSGSPPPRKPFKPAKRDTARSSTRRPLRSYHELTRHRSVCQSRDEGDPSVQDQANSFTGLNVSMIMPEVLCPRAMARRLSQNMLPGDRGPQNHRIGRDVTARRKDDEMIDAGASNRQRGATTPGGACLRAHCATSARASAWRKSLRGPGVWRPVGRLTAGFAHDFDDLLTVLAGNLELILQSTSDDRIDELGPTSAGGGREPGAFLDRRTFVTRTRTTADPRPVNLNDQITGMLLPSSRRAVGQQIAVQLDLAAGIVACGGGSGGNGQQCSNCALNSRDAIPRGGEMWIRTRNQQNREDAERRARTARLCVCSPCRQRRRGNKLKTCASAPSSLSSPLRLKRMAPVSDTDQ